MRFQYSKLHRERGVSFIMAALFLSALCGVVGLAVDGAGIYRIKRIAQNVCDATAVSGARLMLDSLSTQAQRNQVLTTLIPAQIRTSLGVYRISEVNNLSVTQVDTSASKINISFSVPYYNNFMRVVGANPKNDVSVKCGGSNARYAIALVVDITGSMQGQINPAAGSGTKMAALRQEAAHFIEGLPSYDMATLISFNVMDGNNGYYDWEKQARVVRESTTGVTLNLASLSTEYPGLGTQQEIMLKALDKYSTGNTSLTFSGTTNIAAGIERARLHFEQNADRIAEGMEKIIIVLTDGAPHWYRNRRWPDWDDINDGDESGAPSPNYSAQTYTLRNSDGTTQLDGDGLPVTKIVGGLGWPSQYVMNPQGTCAKNGGPEWWFNPYVDPASLDANDVAILNRPILTEDDPAMTTNYSRLPLANPPPPGIIQPLWRWWDNYFLDGTHTVCFPNNLPIPTLPQCGIAQSVYPAFPCCEYYERLAAPSRGEWMKVEGAGFTPIDPDPAALQDQCYVCSPQYSPFCCADPSKCTSECCFRRRRGDSLDGICGKPGWTDTWAPNDSHIIADLEKSRRERFLETIVESDKARDEDIRIFAIGLGPQDNYNGSHFQWGRQSNNNSGYFPSGAAGDFDDLDPGTPENLKNTDDSLKIHLLRRVAFAYTQMASDLTLPLNVDPLTTPSWPWARNGTLVRPWDFPCVASIEALKNDGRPEGKYFEATSQNLLANAFNEILFSRVKLAQ